VVASDLSDTVVIESDVSGENWKIGDGSLEFGEAVKKREGWEGKPEG